jgi:Glycosyl hydrolase family 26
MTSPGLGRASLLGAMVLLVGGLGAACASKSGGAASEGAPDAAATSPADAAHEADAAKKPSDAAAALDVADLDGFTLADAPPSIVPVPSKDAFFGAFVGAEPETQTDPQSEALFTAAEDLINRPWVIDNRFYDDNTDWAGDRTKWDIAQNMIPLVTWMPYGNGDPLDEYIAGVHDAYVIQEAQEAKALGVTILMRWGHEMNGNWYPWSGSDNGGADAGAAGGPAKYIAAYQHVHDLFVSQGATNVVWIWCINVADVPAEPWNHWTSYYPGDAYVDWVGLDAYNWGTSSSCCVWQTFTDLVATPYQDYVGKKPMMLPETASAELGGDKAGWINDMHTALKTEFTGIQAVIWFDINKETDWRINSSPTALAAYRSMALDPYFSAP